MENKLPLPPLAGLPGVSEQLPIDGADGSSTAAMSVRAFARLIGVSHTSVQNAIREGRLVRSVTRTSTTGTPVITDPDLARQEWAGAGAGVAAGSGTAPAGDPGQPKTLTAARLQKAIEQVRALRLANDQRAGKLAPVEEMERRFTTRVVAARTKILGVPSRAKQRLPHLTTTDLAVIDELLREALEDLASELAVQMEAQTA
jgi:phage terminase Nu1 subunit (DNA packaging protein)